mgnify:CR=1 FL=1
MQGAPLVEAPKGVDRKGGKGKENRKKREEKRKEENALKKVWGAVCIRKRLAYKSEVLCCLVCGGGLYRNSVGPTNHFVCITNFSCRHYMIPVAPAHNTTQEIIFTQDVL